MEEFSLILIIFLRLNNICGCEQTFFHNLLFCFKIVWECMSTGTYNKYVIYVYSK